MGSVNEYFNQLEDDVATPTLETEIKNRYGG